MTYYDIDGDALYKKQRQIDIGFKGENIVTRVYWDTTAIENQLGQNGSFSVVASVDSYNSGQAYNVVSTYENHKLYWVVDSGTLANIGSGKVQYTYTLGSQVKKSPKMPIKISSSLAQSTTPPQAYQSYVDLVASYKDQCIQAKNEILTTLQGLTWADLSPVTEVE